MEPYLRVVPPGGSPCASFRVCYARTRELGSAVWELGYVLLSH